MTDLREMLRTALPLAERLARWSETAIDDRVVGLLGAMLASDPLWGFLEELLGQVTPPPPLLVSAASGPAGHASGPAVDVPSAVAEAVAAAPLAQFPPEAVRAAAEAHGLAWPTVVALLPAVIRLVLALRLLVP